LILMEGRGIAAATALRIAGGNIPQ